MFDGTTSNYTENKPFQDVEGQEKTRQATKEVWKIFEEISRPMLVRDNEVTKGDYGVTQAGDFEEEPKWRKRGVNAISDFSPGYDSNGKKDVQLIIKLNEECKKVCWVNRVYSRVNGSRLVSYYIRLIGTYFAGYIKVFIWIFVGRKLKTN
ncbi:hypothetical protein Hdeb2414_s0012g00380571 [Helianthus debilis subsp. tardiflorus]